MIRPTLNISTHADTPTPCKVDSRPRVPAARLRLGSKEEYTVPRSVLSAKILSSMGRVSYSVLAIRNQLLTYDCLRIPSSIKYPYTKKSGLSIHMQLHKECMFLNIRPFPALGAQRDTFVFYQRSVRDEPGFSPVLICPVIYAPLISLGRTDP